jgi:DNA-binding response OmpR family regulator
MPARDCLIIDDDPIAATWLLELLRSRGHAAVLSCGLEQAESHLSGGGFGRVIVDRRLPDGDGLQWLQRRSDPLPWPVLLTSGDELSGAAMPDGVVFLRKPIDQDSLLRWLNHETTASATPAPEGDATSTSAELPILSDEPALTRLGGRAETLQALRLMLLKELQTAHSWISTLRQPQALLPSVGHLHRLGAACALTGCARLGHISSELESRLRAGHGLSDEQQQRIETIFAQTVSRLERSTTAAMVSPQDYPA